MHNFAPAASLNSCLIIYNLDEKRYLFIAPSLNSIAGITAQELAADKQLWHNLISDANATNICGQIDNMVINDEIEFSYQITTPQQVVKNVVDKRSISADAITGHQILISIVSEEHKFATPEDMVTGERLEIKNAAQKLDAFIESITDSFFIMDKHWRFVRVNAAFEKISNKTRKHMLGKVIWDLFPSIINTGFGKAYHEANEKQESVKFVEYFDPLNMWFSTSVYPSAEGTTVFIRDITHEKRAQEEATWAKNSLEALINNTHDQIWSVDTEMRYVYLNEAYIRQIKHITGFEPQEGSYSYNNEGYPDCVIEDWKQYYRRALNGEQYTITSESTDLITNQPLFFEVSFNPIYTSSGEIIGVGCFGRNITLWLKTEQELTNQNERLRNIANLSSHEIRRPVASMIGLIGVMDRDNFFNPENEEIIEHLLTVSNEIDDIIRLIVDNTFTGAQ